MFSKPTDPGTAPTPRPAGSGSNAGRSVLGADLRISGEITTSGSVEVLGEIDGNITAQGLIIGQEGRVKGTVTADSVEVRGRLDGKVKSQSFTLRSTAVVAADVIYTSLVIESGASIEGKFNKPKA